jgi:hypothetical protein
MNKNLSLIGEEETNYTASVEGHEDSSQRSSGDMENRSMSDNNLLQK